MVQRRAADWWNDRGGGECRNAVCMGSSGREVVYGWDGERRSRCTVGVGAGVWPPWALAERSRGDMYSATCRPGNALPRRRTGAVRWRYHQSVCRGLCGDCCETAHNSKAVTKRAVCRISGQHCGWLGRGACSARLQECGLGRMSPLGPVRRPSGGDLMPGDRQRGDAPRPTAPAHSAAAARLSAAQTHSGARVVLGRGPLRKGEVDGEFVDMDGSRDAGRVCALPRCRLRIDALGPARLPTARLSLRPRRRDRHGGAANEIDSCLFEPFRGEDC
jgi:hypothetical protein